MGENLRQVQQSHAAGLEQLIRDLNDPRNQAAPDTINVIQRQIQSLQRDPSAWQAALDLLDHPEPQMRFYGALTLKIKVGADWSNDKIGDDRNAVAQLIERVVSSYMKLAAIPDATFVLQKLCVAMVAIFQQTNSAWALPVRHLLACAFAGHYVQQENTGNVSSLLATKQELSSHQVRAVLLFARTLAEEISGSAGSTKSNMTLVQISNNAMDVWDIISACTHFLAGTTGGGSSDSPSHQLYIVADAFQSLKLAKSIIELVPYWTEYVKIKGDAVNSSGIATVFDHFQATAGQLIHFFAQDELANDVLQTFTTLEQHSHTILHKATPEYASIFIQSGHAANWIREMLAGDFSPEAVAYVDFIEAFMSSIDVTTPEYLQNRQCVAILTQVQQLLSCDGSAGVDDPVCQVALEIVTSVTEGYSDWEDSSVHRDGMYTLVTQACGACLEKIRLPVSELKPSTSSWDIDDRTKFQDFRYDVQDFLQNAFTVLGLPLIEEVVRGIVDQNASWVVTEGNLFALLAFSDTMGSEPDKFDQYLDAILESTKWQFAMTRDSQTPERVRKIMIKFLSEHTFYLQRHANSLVMSLNFLFESLQMESSTTAASKAILDLCDAERTALIEALPQFMSSLDNISQLEPDAKNRILGAISAIIQALPEERARVQPLLQLLQVVQTDAHAILAADLDPVELRNKATDVLSALTAIGKGLRSPSDASVELETTATEDSTFWTQGEGSVVQQTALQIYTLLDERADARDDSLFVEAICDFLKSAFTENHPSPFKLPPSVVLEVLDRQIRITTPQPDVVIGTASSYLASANTTDPDSNFVSLFTHILQECEKVLETSRHEGRAVHSEFTAAGLEFFGRMLPKWATLWLSMPNAPATAQVMINLGLVLLNDTDTMTRRAAASFFTAFFEATANTTLPSDPHASSIMTSILHQYAGPILAAILSLLAGECARSELESLTEPLKRAVLRQPLVANKIIKEAVKDESAVLTVKALQATKPEQRARFAAQVEMLRGARKTNEIVRGFWIDCRGSGFGYVT